MPSQGVTPADSQGFDKLDVTSMFGLDEAAEPLPDDIPVIESDPNVMPNITHWSRSTIISGTTTHQYYQACVGLAATCHPSLLCGTEYT